MTYATAHSALLSTLQVIALVTVALGATAVVLVRRPARQVLILSTYGLALCLLFMVFQAPDVALSILSVGSVVLPLLLLLALAKMRKQEE
ncbi:MAG: hydrogenase subunit MbhD domain-containing protein [Acidimicrobiales bacterium]